VVFLILSTIIGGLIIGALARLLVPGPNPMGLGLTILIGIVGSILGGAIARGIYVRPQDHWAVTFLLELIVAVVLVALISGGRHRRRR